MRKRTAVRDHRLGPVRRHDDECGATAVEYALVVGAIAVVIIIAVAYLGNSLASDFDCSGSAIEAMPNPPACSP